MRKRILPSLALAAAATLALGAGHARATNVSTNQVGDLFLGFEASGSPDDLEVDLGSISTFQNATSAFQVPIGVSTSNTNTVLTNLNADLGIFGSGGTWASNTSLLWGLTGLATDGGHYYVFATQDSANTTVPFNLTFSQDNTAKSGIFSLLGGSGLSGDPNDGISTVAADVPTGNANSWTSFGPNSSGFGTGVSLEQQAGDSAVGSVLNLYELTPNSNGTGAATDVGSFTLDSSGDLTFTPASVPEPTTWASILSGGAVLAFFRRRRGLRAS